MGGGGGALSAAGEEKNVDFLLQQNEGADPRNHTAPSPLSSPSAVRHVSLGRFQGSLKDRTYIYVQTSTPFPPLRASLSVFVFLRCFGCVYS